MPDPIEKKLYKAGLNPGSSYSIKEFSDKVKGAFPQYKDIEDTLLVRKIYKRFPHFKESIRWDEEPYKEGYELTHKKRTQLDRKIGHSLSEGKSRKEIDKEIKEFKDEESLPNLNTGHFSENQTNAILEAVGRLQKMGYSDDDIEKVVLDYGVKYNHPKAIEYKFGKEDKSVTANLYNLVQGIGYGLVGVVGNAISEAYNSAWQGYYDSVKRPYVYDIPVHKRDQLRHSQIVNAEDHRRRRVQATKNLKYSKEVVKANLSSIE